MRELIFEELANIGVNGSTPNNNSPWYYDATTAAPIPVYEEEDEDINDRSPIALVLPRISAVLSLLAVICVTVEAFKDYEADRRMGTISNTLRSNRKVPTVTHIQLFFQIPLFIQAIALALGTTPAPASQGIWGAVGTTQTCSFQGLLVQLSMLGSVGWDVALSATYLFMARYQWQPQRLQRTHKYYHLAIWPIALAMSLYPLTQGMYNFNTTVCWLETYPSECSGDECERGAGARLWQNITSLIAVLHFVYSTVVLGMLYCTIRGLEDDTRNSSSSSSSSKSSTTEQQQPTERRYSKAVGIQGMLYASVIIITVLPSVLVIFLWNAVGVWNEGFSVFATTTTPLMGYFNFVIFMRGRRVEDCHTRYAKFLRRIHNWMFQPHCRRLRAFVCCCKCHCEWTGPGKRRRQSSGALDQTASSTHRRGEDQPFPPPPSPNKTSSSGKNTLSSGKSSSKKSVVSWEDERTPPKETAAQATTLTLKGMMGYLVSWGSKTSDATHSQVVVSELTKDPTTMGHPEHQCATGDFVPSKPKRQISGAFDAPAKPTRAITEEESMHDMMPPMIPRRNKSHMSEITLESGLRSFASNKLESYVSEMTLEEVEDWHVGCSSSHHHSAVAPPAKPERCASEAEETSEEGNESDGDEFASESVDSPTNNVPTPTLAPDMQAAMRFVKRAILEDEDVSKNSNGMSPPAKPTRYLSEVEPSDTPEDESDAADLDLEMGTRRPEAKGGGEAPPIRPVRCASELDDEWSEDEEC